MLCYVTMTHFVTILYILTPKMLYDKIDENTGTISGIWSYVLVQETEESAVFGVIKIIFSQ